MTTTPPKNSAWQIVEESTYAAFRIFSAKRSRRINPRTGKPFDFFLMEGFDWTNAIVLTPSGRIVLVEQYRHGAEKWTLELPGGTVEPGEPPSDTAAREILEETGFELTSLSPLGTIYANPAMQSMRMHGFLAHTKSETPLKSQSLDGGEDIRIITMPLQEFLDSVKNGHVDHALTVAITGLYLLNR